MDGFEIHISSDPKYAKVVRCGVGHICELCGFPAKTGRAIVLAVDEAVTNIIRHAYSSDHRQKLTVQCSILDDRLEIVLQDSGTAANIETMKSRDLTNVRPGGLGMHFINTTMDIVDYQSNGTAGNQLTLTKYLPKDRDTDA
ncbi:MAG: ATP-binding protein [Calditrichaeota bacterium]|nr:ATP-binding protein [Calditrichota bacterium]